MRALVNSSHDKKVIQILEEQLAYMQQQNKDLSKQIEALTEQVRQLTQLLYGSKTEKSKYTAPDGQVSLFEDEPSFNEPEHTGEQSQCYLFEHCRNSKSEWSGFLSVPCKVTDRSTEPKHPSQPRNIKPIHALVQKHPNSMWKIK